MSNGLIFPSVRADSLETFAYRHAMILATVYSILINLLLPSTSSHLTVATINLVVGLFATIYEASIFKKRFPDEYSSSFLKIKPLSEAIFLSIKYCIALIGIFIIFSFIYSKIVKIEPEIFDDLLFAVASAYMIGGLSAFLLLNIYFELMRFKKPKN